MTDGLRLGDRVFVGGHVGRYGRITTIQRGAGSVYYMVHLDGDGGHSGPFTEVWPELKAPERKVGA